MVDSVIETTPDFVEDDFFDSWAYGGTEEFVLPGKVHQSVTFKILTESDRVAYEKLTNKDVRVDRRTDQAILNIDPGAERHALLLIAITDWTLYSRGTDGQRERMAFSQTMLKNWLQVANPKIIDDLADAIRTKNPWIGADAATLEDLEDELADLQKRIAEKKREEMGKA